MSPQKHSNGHFVIRRYKNSDKDAVLKLFTDGILEHINPSFFTSIRHPLHVGVTLFLFMGWYVFAGGCLLSACLLSCGWVGLVYYSCYKVYKDYVIEKLHTEMQDIPGNYLSNPRDCFWVAETEVDGRSQICGMVAIKAKKVINTQGGECQGDDGRGGEWFGELFRMVVSSSCRRCGLGYRLAQTAVDFCREHKFVKIVLETTSTQTSGAALYYKMGFRTTMMRSITITTYGLAGLSRVYVLRMEKVL